MEPHVAIVYSSDYQIDMGGFEELHLHPQRYDKTYLALEVEGLIRPEEVFAPAPVTREQILRVHTEEFLASLEDPQRVAEYVEIPVIAALPAKLIDTGMLSAFRCATGGTIEAARLAVKHGIAVNIGGGYHHAKPDAGEGFCIYNDIAIAVGASQDEGIFRRALIVDLDVHQGNGTAACFKTDSDVFTFSMHEKDIYPIPKEVSDLDSELPGGTGDDKYLKALEETLSMAFKMSRPEIAFLVAGVDVLENDPLASLQMTRDGVVKRDAMVIDECVRREIPVVMTLAGGYSENAWEVQYASIRRTIETYGLAGKS
ncbi:MAG: histone deacetylase family protein [Planctomycetota bacterium]|jgi:histone deacetylase 11